MKRTAGSHALAAASGGFHPSGHVPAKATASRYRADRPVMAVSSIEPVARVRAILAALPPFVTPRSTSARYRTRPQLVRIELDRHHLSGPIHSRTPDATIREAPQARPSVGRPCTRPLILFSFPHRYDFAVVWTTIMTLSTGYITVQVSPVPEPSSFALMLGGLASIVRLKRRRE